MTRVLVTGGGGFIGRTLCDHLERAGYIVRIAARSSVRSPVSDRYETVIVGDIDAHTSWDTALEGVEYVIHAAARVHVLRASPTTEQLYFQTNAEGTKRLAVAAARMGVRRLVYMSSVKVNGECTKPGAAYSPADIPQPEDAYGKSKMLGEQHVLEVGSTTTLQTAVLRTPLVYGPGVRANFLRLMRWVARGIPIPLAAVCNRRSLAGVWNVADLLERLLIHAAVAGRVWMVSDDQDLSTPELIRKIGDAMGKPARLVPVPMALLTTMGSMIGARDEIKRLCGSLAVDVSATRRELNWTPPVSVEEGLARTVRWYVARAHE